MTQLNLDNLSKMSTDIETVLPEKLNKIKKQNLLNTPEDLDQIMTVNPNISIQNRNIQNSEDIEIDNGIDLSKTISTFKPDVYTIYGFSLPKNTLYLIIILIIVGIGVWYITSNNKKKETKILEEKDVDKEE